MPKEKTTTEELAGAKVCQFCGQYLLSDDLCDCAEAKQERQRQEQIDCANISLNGMFGERCVQFGYTPIDEQNISVMKKMITELAYRRIYSVQFSFPGGTRAKLQNKQGTIKIERTETNKQVDEIDERIVD